MIKSNLLPCTDWVQKLAARNLDDLSLTERSALNEHLALCRACNEVHTAYQTLEKGFLNLLSSKPAPVFSLQLPRQESKAIPKLELSVQNLITLLWSAFSSLFMKISWSQLYQKLHTWVLIAPAHFPQKVYYVQSNSHYSYAIRSDSGFILWQQKRYNGHNLVSTAPIRWSGISYAGAGTAYVSALDFCRYAVQA